MTIATLAWFLAAARTMDGPPMSISSTSSSNVTPGAAGGRGERVEIHDDEVERGDPCGEQGFAVAGPPAIGEESAVNPGVERLDPPVEHLAESP